MSTRTPPDAHAAYSASATTPQESHHALDQRLTRLAACFLVAIAAWLVALGLFNVVHPSDWSMGDWLINYAGGFIRRGLPGQVAQLLHRAAGVPALWSILLLQWTLYAVFLVGIWRLVQPLRWSWWLAASVFSPASLAFVLLTPSYAFRKEILFFVLLLCATGVFQRKRPGTAKTTPSLPTTSLLLAAGAAVCLLSHEGLFAFMAYLFAALFLRFGHLRQASRVFAAPALVSLALLGLTTRFPGNATAARAICASVGGSLTTPPSGICGGAIDYLSHDAAYAHAQVKLALGNAHHPAQWLWLFLLPLVPGAAGLFALRRSSPKAVAVIGCAAVVAALLSVPLYFYGTDWPRWTYIHVVCLLILTLVLEGQRQRSAPGTLQSTPQALTHADGTLRWVPMSFLLLFCLGWQLTEYTPRPLYGGLIRFVTHNMARGQQ